MNDLDNKYIDLLTNICIKKDSHSLFLSYYKEITPFIKKLKEKVLDMGITDIYEEIIDPNELHNMLKKLSVEEISTHPYFNKSIWDVYAKKDSNFLMFVTEYPHLFDDIESEKLSKMAKVSQETKPLYRKLQNKCKIAWAIAAYPGEKWAKDIYSGNDSYEKLKNAIFKMCMVDKANPITSWKKRIDDSYKIVTYLNKLNIDNLHYTNSLGTNLTVYLPDNYIFESALDNEIMANMPSYEVFTSPIYNKTEGIVYSSIPLIYEGSIIEDFYLKFHEGKVVEMNAKKGLDTLKCIVSNDDNSCYLGECALVEKDSPIASMNTIFKTTLIDENASCHLALGAGFAECLKDGISLSDDEILKCGVNISKTHVDFMIGTNDLNIIAALKDGSTIKIFEDGKYSKELLDKID